MLLYSKGKEIETVSCMSLFWTLVLVRTSHVIILQLNRLDIDNFAQFVYFLVRKRLQTPPSDELRRERLLRDAYAR